MLLLHGAGRRAGARTAARYYYGGWLHRDPRRPPPPAPGSSLQTSIPRARRLAVSFAVCISHSASGPMAGQAAASPAWSWAAGAQRGGGGARGCLRRRPAAAVRAARLARAAAPPPPPRARGARRRGGGRGRARPPPRINKHPWCGESHFLSTCITQNGRRMCAWLDELQRGHHRSGV
jgi:hypothetical protein